jgi:hypothetical protein
MEMTKMTTPAQEVLTKLADHYEKHPEQWRRDGVNMNKSFCILNGIKRFAPGLRPWDVDREARDLVREALNREHGIANWNDHVARGVSEVVAVLRKAATL